MAVVDIHDVHTLVTHEVPFVPIALWEGHEDTLRQVPSVRPGPPNPGTLSMPLPK